MTVQGFVVLLEGIAAHSLHNCVGDISLVYKPIPNTDAMRIEAECDRKGCIPRFVVFALKESEP